MFRSSMVVTAAAGAALLAFLLPVQAQTVMQQCGQQYQAAKAAGTLNGMTWNQFRVDCAAKMKATPASTGAAPAVPSPATNPLKPATTTAAAPAAPAPTPAAPAPAAPAPASAAPAVAAGKATVPATGGRAAMLTRERQCGAEWRAQKVSLVAQTPGLTWPKYWSQCNTRLKAAGQ